VGVHLCSRQDEEALTHLYAVNNYYVEIVFPLHPDKGIYFRAFSSMAKLEPYLEDIDIEYLFL
jgi:hypothetical protein